MGRVLASLCLSVFATFSLVAQGATPAPKDAKVYIISPKDGETVSSPVTVLFGLEGMGVAPAGIAKENTGHHHLLVDAKEMPAAGKPIAKDAQHMHFGGGQTQTVLTLAPGTHTLQLIMGDTGHIPHSPAVASPVVTITVK